VNRFMDRKYDSTGPTQENSEVNQFPGPATEQCQNHRRSRKRVYRYAALQKQGVV